MSSSQCWVIFFFYILLLTYEIYLQVLSQLIEKSIGGDTSGFGLTSDFSQHDLHPNPGHPRAVDWIFVLDTLNFSFWSSNPRNKWRVDGQTGYFALCAAIKRAIEVSEACFYNYRCITYT